MTIKDSYNFRDISDRITTSGGPLEAVAPRERLLHLDAAPVPMQVAERAQIDEDVEGQRIAAAVFAQQIVVSPAVAGREIE